MKKQIRRKRHVFGSVNALYEGQELIFNAFNSGIFPFKHYKESESKQTN